MMPGAVLRLAALGTLSRLGVALAATRLLAKLPYDLSPSDPLTTTCRLNNFPIFKSSADRTRSVCNWVDGLTCRAGWEPCHYPHLSGLAIFCLWP